MVLLRRITPEMVAEYKEVRLRALLDTPSAFGSTYARENAFSEEEWERRALNLDGVRAVGYMTFGQDGYCGLVVCFRDEGDASKANVYSMWVAPECRRSGVGGMLIDAVADWAREVGAKTLVLMVTSRNEAANRFYRGKGFSLTGRTEPYPNDAALLEYEMAKELA